MHSGYNSRTAAPYVFFCRCVLSYLQSNSSKDFQRCVIDMLEDAEVVSTMLLPGLFMSSFIQTHLNYVPYTCILHKLQIQTQKSALTITCYDWVSTFSCVERYSFQRWMLVTWWFLCFREVCLLWREETCVWMKETQVKWWGYREKR